MTREEAIEIARKCAKANPESYYVEPFEPHEWVVDAVLEAANGRRVPEPAEGTCGLCGKPMPPGEEVFKYHGYSGPCPK